MEQNFDKQKQIKLEADEERNQVEQLKRRLKVLKEISDMRATFARMEEALHQKVVVTKRYEEALYWAGVQLLRAEQTLMHVSIRGVERQGP